MVRGHRERARHALSRLLAAKSLDLVQAAFWVAAEEYPDLDVARQIARVGMIASEGGARAVGARNPFARLDRLQVYFFEQLGFRGNLESYDDPRNSYLNEVLDRRLGIPLTLCVLFMETARSAGFRARGVGLPGHFICRLERAGRTILVDPFHQGRVITEEDCRQLVARSTGRPSLFRREQLDGATERSMLGRMLLNLKHIFLSRADYARALSVVERLLLVWPDDSNEVRDRGFLKAHLGQPGAAIADLESYLTRAPGAADTESVKGRLAWLRRKLPEAN